MTWRVAYEVDWQGVEKLYIVRSYGNTKLVVQPIAFTKVHLGQTVVEPPSMTISPVEVQDGFGSAKDFLQAAMDTAYSLGLWPTSAPKATSAEMEAVRYHLEDMRGLALGRRK